MGLRLAVFVLAACALFALGDGQAEGAAAPPAPPVAVDTLAPAAPAEQPAAPAGEAYSPPPSAEEVAAAAEAAAQAAPPADAQERTGNDAAAVAPPNEEERGGDEAPRPVDGGAAAPVAPPTDEPAPPAAPRQVAAEDAPAGDASVTEGEGDVGAPVADAPTSTPGRPNSRADPRTRKALGEPVSPSPRPLYNPNDDYYGLMTDPKDRVDPTAFQPDHILAFEIGPGASVELFEDVPPEGTGRAVRGDWFVTSGEELALRVAVLAPDGNDVYDEGPLDESGKAVDAGAFRFVLPRPGTYTIRFTNPSPEDTRTVTFAWLMGKDEDDPYTRDMLEGERGGERGGDAMRRAAARAGGPNPTAPPRAGPPNSGEGGAAPPPAADLSTPDKVTAVTYVKAMLRRLSHLHKRLDALNAQLQYADVKFARHLGLATATGRKVNLWSAAETATVVLAAALQLWVVRGFQFKLPGAPTGAARGADMV